LWEGECVDDGVLCWCGRGRGDGEVVRGRL
jgi:hypothetical protein